VAPSRRLKKLVSAALPHLEMPDGPSVVALSGGADSAALALLAREAGHPVRAVHVDHGFGASPTLRDAAAAIAGELDLPLRVVAVTVEEGPSPEGQARDARYSVLTELDEPVVTGHTRDDSVETMLINLARGTGASGLVGIPRFRPPNIHRPMLAVTRSTTREIATLAGLRFVDDPMNETLSLTRNRVRLQVLPLLRELNPQVEAALARTAATLERESEYLEHLAGEHGGTRTVPMAVVTTLPRVVADRVLRRLLEATNLEPTSDRIERMWSVASGESQRQQLADGKTVLHRGAMLVIE
jgi:tRNA(Ile)-lysidine synthase